MKFASILKELRLQKNVTTEDMGNLLNISRQAYSKYENGMAEPTLEKLLKLADYFNVSTDFLLGRNDIENHGEYNNLFSKINKLNKEKIEALEILLK